MREAGDVKQGLIGVFYSLKSRQEAALFHPEVLACTTRAYASKPG